MDCSYCGAVNLEDEHRCARCGRRLNAVMPVSTRSAAVALAEHGASPLIAMPKREPPAPRVPHQQNLFRVIPFEAISPPPKKEESGPRRPLPKKISGRAPESGQDRFAFVEAGELVQQITALCQGPVASFQERWRATAFNFLMIAAAAGLFLGGFVLWTRELPAARDTWWIHGAALGLIAGFYRLLGCVLSDRSPGMRFAGIRLLQVDGKPTSRRKRLLRELAVLLSLLPAGFGFLWALLDEEHLTFHDHISETFPSPDAKP